LNRYLDGTASVIDAERASLIKEVSHWVGRRFAGYLLVMVGSALAFFIWATFYTYVWPGRPPAVSIEAPAPTITPTPTVVPPAPDTEAGALVASGLPADALSITQLRKLHIYDPNNERIGEIEDVLFSPDGKIYAYVIGLGGFLGMQQKDIAVPVHALQFKKTDNSDGHLILNMSKDAARNAPQFEYGKMKWGEGNWRLTPPPQ
jgi:hypothetical protein